MTARKQTMEILWTHSVQSAAAYLGLSAHRVADLARKGALGGQKSPVEGTNISVWRFTQADLDAYKSQRGERKGGKKYLVRVSAEQYDEVAAWLAERGMALEVANPRKAKSDGEAFDSILEPSDEDVTEAAQEVAAVAAA